MALTPQRLKRRAEFLLVASRGRRVATPGMVVQALTRPDRGPIRIGFTVTKKLGDAVVRNRSRRRLKEAARLLLREQEVNGLDLVLVGRAATRTRPFAALIEDLRGALARLAPP